MRGDERRPEIAEGGFTGLSNLLFGHEDADRSVIRVELPRRCGSRTPTRPGHGCRGPGRADLRNGWVVYADLVVDVLVTEQQVTDQ